MPIRESGNGAVFVGRVVVQIIEEIAQFIRKQNPSASHLESKSSHCNGVRVIVLETLPLPTILAGLVILPALGPLVENVPPFFTEFVFYRHACIAPQIALVGPIR